MAINWNLLLTEYNERYNTECDVRSMLENLYAETKSMQRMEKVLGVSKYSIRAKMASLGIPIQKKGGDYQSRGIVSKFLSIPDSIMSKMTAKQIAEEIGANRNYIYELTFRFNKPFNAIKTHERRVRNEQCSNSSQ